MKKHFRTIAKVTLVLTYLVIFAGAFVRMTGSGMGCPDWPKCFGYYIPPTELSQLEFHPNHDYKKGVVIIKDESLLVVKQDFISQDSIDLNQWEPYTKHDYAIFNPLHTWVEYINRLMGALAGLATLVLLIASLKHWRKNKFVSLLSGFIVIGMGFQAWLGKTVVDSNLAPLKITIHMVMALILVACILYIINATSKKPIQVKKNRLSHKILILAIILTLIQIVLGTQVRQYIDEQIKTIGYIKSMWLENPQLNFYLHRSFSLIVLLVNLWLFRRNKRLNLGFHKINLIMLAIVLEILTGILMYYFDFPFASQTIHLVIATLLFGVQFYVLLEYSQDKKTILD